MQRTTVGGEHVEPQPGCWCCGGRLVSASLLRLEGRSEVGVCFRCVDRLAKRKRAIERMTPSYTTRCVVAATAVPRRVQQMLITTC